MGSKIVLVAFVVLCFIQTIRGAPNRDSSSEKHELMEKFVEFLHEDKEFAGLLENPSFLVNGGVVRNRRQADNPGMDIDDIDQLDKPKEAGFFDRAAKFVMEVLQRFLKWINSD